PLCTSTLSFAPGHAGRIRQHGRLHSREPLSERQRHPRRRRDPAGAEVESSGLGNGDLEEHTTTVATQSPRVPTPNPEPPIPNPQFRIMKAFDIKRGTVVEHNGKVWQVRDVERSSPTARGGNVTFRFTLYSVPGAQKLDLSLRAEEELVETELT